MFDATRDLFLNEHGSYARSKQFYTLVTFVVVMIIFTQSFPKNYGFVIILIVFALFIANSYVEVENYSVNDNNKILMHKLYTLQSKTNNFITEKVRSMQNTKLQLSDAQLSDLIQKNKLDSLYIDSNMISFLYSIIALNEYNPNEFYLMLKATNKILKIKNEIEIFYNENKEYPKNTSELLQEALDLRTKAINNMHNFIYAIPKTNTMYKYLNDIVNRYNVLLSRSTDAIHKYYKLNLKMRGIDTTTNFVSYNTTKPFDRTLNNSSFPVKHTANTNTLLQFYV